ncbi:S8 family serine peptidase, partial [bacterium]|nr:S8 family serine peptidase [bacterium]
MGETNVIPSSENKSDTGMLIHRVCCAFSHPLRSLMLTALGFVLSLSAPVLASHSPGELIVRLAHPPVRNALDDVVSTGVRSIDSLVAARQITATTPYQTFARRFPRMESVLHMRMNPETDLDSLAAVLEADPGIEWVTLNHHYRLNRFESGGLDEGFRPDDSLFSVQWWLERMSVPLAWDISRGDSTIVIGIVDTGVDYLHPDLRANLWFNWAEKNGVPGEDDDDNGFVDDSIGWDFVDAPGLPAPGDYLARDNDPMDEMGHGTYVSGMASAVTDNGTCVAGVGFHCRIMALRTGNANGFLEEDDVAAAILYGAQMRANVLNMSFGDVVVSPLIRDAVQLAARERVVLLGSAGNANSQTIHYPSGFAEVIAVGATTQTDQRASFSNYGPSVDVMAPGYYIWSTILGGGCGEWIHPHGTSYAVALVSGVAGLMLAVNPDLGPNDVKQILRSTADDIGSRGWDPQTTNGRVNARRAVEQAAFGSSVVARITRPPMDAGLADDFEVYGEAWGGAFQSWSLSYGLGENPTSWERVNSGEVRTYGGLLGEVQIPTVDTVMILQLEARGFEGSRSVDNVHLYIQRTPPRVDSTRTRVMLDRDGYGQLVQVWTNQIGNASFLVTNARGDSLRQDLGYVTREHAGFLSQWEYDGDWMVRIRLENMAGLVTMTESFPFGIHDPPFSSNLWATTVTSLHQVSYLSSFLTDADCDGRPEVWRLPIGRPTLPRDMDVWEWTGTDFVVLPLRYGVHVPQAVGDADGDGLLEMMGDRSEITRIWEQRNTCDILDTLVFEDTTRFVGGGFLDLDVTDGHGEIVAEVFTDATGFRRPRFVIFAVDANYTLTAIDTIPNETYGDNSLGPPRLLVGDLDRDGQTDFLYGDYDGDLIFCERVNGRSVQKWSYRLPMNDATNWFDSGDFDGDGEKEIVAGCRSSALAATESTRRGLHWGYFIFECAGDDLFTPVDSLFVLGNENVITHHASVNSGDVNGDGRDEILISAYPDQYVVAWDPASGRYLPQWYYWPSESNVSLVADLDGDGTSEFLFNDGEQILRAVSTTISQARPRPPFALAGEPLGPSTLHLWWRAAANADSYRVYRAQVPPAFLPFSVTLDTQVVLENVPTNESFVYAVATVSSMYPSPESVLSNYVTLVANDPPTAEDTAKYFLPHFVHVRFSEPMGAAALRQGGYRL